jgi:methionyl-tRNA formyltransferase
MTVEAPGQTYVVTGSKPWNRRLFDDTLSKLPGRWHYVGSTEQLTAEAVRALDPRYIFFLHWSWKVPDEIVDGWECVCFHMTDVPYGRGGSPLQNLIARGHRQTKLTALRMTGAFDAGPVYMKEDLCLEGGAEEIYIRAAALSAEMVRRIAADEPAPLAQSGEAVVFKRRRPEESEIPRLDSLGALHDFIRMLDAEGYPRAFLDQQGFRYEFSRAALYDGRVVADVTITMPEGKK